MRLTDQHHAIRDTMARFVETEINPHVEEWERDGIWPAHEVLGKMGKLGLLGIDKPEDCGGQGLDYSYHACFLEALGGCRSSGVSMGISVNTDMATPAIAKHGSEELKRNYLEPLLKGEMVASIAVSEPHAGSDVAQIKTTARVDGDDYVIDGTKMWITNSTQADWICLLANTGDGQRHTNKSLIVVPMDAKGISLSPKLDKLGMRASDTAQIFFDGVRVPRRNLVGAEGRGFSMQMEQFQEERLSAAFVKPKALEMCIQDTIAYTSERHVFGQPLIDNQVVYFKMAELMSEVEALRSMAWRATELMLDGNDVTLLASMAKLKAGRLGRLVPDACLQYWGGQGFMWDNFVARCYRDMRLTSIGGGADEVMLQIIAKKMGCFPKG